MKLFPKPSRPAALRCLAALLAAVNLAATAADNEAAPAPASVKAAERTDTTEKTEAAAPQTNTVAVASATAAPAPASPAPAKATNAVAPLSLESFQGIADKNIFNQSRVPRVAGRPASTTNEVKRVPKVDAIALVGTMSYEKGDFAFFDSPNAEYRKTLKAVQPSHVTLEWEGTALDVKVGQQLRREDDGPWQVSSRTESFASSGSSGSGGSGGSSADGGASSASSSSTSGSRSETLKRLLEQRAKQRQ
jgi:uncharacterized membrane protein YgcG